MTEISVGIDLGTTNSCISTCWPNGQPRLLRDEAGIGVIPSVVSFTEDGHVEVGQKARMRLLSDPVNTFLSTKRFIGRDMRTDENRYAAAQYTYTIEPGKNGIPMAVTRDKRLPIYQISGSVLRYLKEIAERGVGQEVKKAVITVPANFNEVQRRSTHQAGEFAGFEVLRIFNEPTAAALAYGLGRTGKKVVAVYDFGGGTFDITILRLEDPVFEVMATSGDMLLGGDDFDRRLREDMFEQFRNEYGFDPGDDLSLVQRFNLGAERMKCQLTDWIVTAFEDRHVRNPDGQTMPPFHYETNRDRFRSLVDDLVDRSFQVCDEAFRLAAVNPDQIDDVILVGGTTRIPFLRERVEQYFGKPPLEKIQPDVVVSMGAAIQAYSLSGGDLIYPAAAGDMLPIRKVEARPPAPKTAKGSEFELLDDLSEDLKADEEAVMHRLTGAGRTVRGTPAARPGGDSVPPALPDGAHRPPSAQPAAKGKTLPFPQPASWPSMSGSVDELDAPHEAAPTRPLEGSGAEARALDLPTPAGGPSSRDDLLPGVLDNRKPSRPQPAVDADLPVPFGTPDEPTFDSLPPAPSGIEPPLVQPPGLPAAEPTPASGPASALPFGAPPTQADVEEARSLTFEALEAKPQEAPVVTPEQAARPYVTREIVDEVRRVETSEAAGEPLSSPGDDGRQEVQPARAPLLLDVTANTLSVATLGGFIEVLVSKNSPLPIEKRHLFTTGADFQERAVIKVVEGESNRAEENHNLGEVELVDIRKAVRGEIKIEVMFEITVDGILKVSARNLETGEAQSARLTLFGG
ncbi:MAG: Hsp70 family protein [Deltaproteobacteria bacterium]|nr:Hsp70 family protein [Deltaproteobacteria bacterium]